MSWIHDVIVHNGQETIEPVRFLLVLDQALLVDRTLRRRRRGCAAWRGKPPATHTILPRARMRDERRAARRVDAHRRHRPRHPVVSVRTECVGKPCSFRTRTVSGWIRDVHGFERKRTRRFVRRRGERLRRCASHVWWKRRAHVTSTDRHRWRREDTREGEEEQHARGRWFQPRRTAA